MPVFSEKEIKTALGQARLLGITHYSKPCDNTIFFFDEDTNLRMRIKLGFKLWTGSIAGHYDARNELHPIDKLRKRYEH